jgi:hypothetical protein
MIKHTVFSQLMQIIYRYNFKKSVDRYNGDRYTKQFNCWQQLIVLIFAQARGLKSLRDIQISLRSQRSKWYHLGLKSVAKSTLADANNNRDSDIFKEVFYDLLARCRELSPRHKFRFRNPLYTMDSTLVRLCLSIFPWAKYRRMKGALKIHTLLDHSGCLPSFITVTEGKYHDINVLKDKTSGFPALLPDSIITVDRAYIDYNWLYSLTKQRVFFVTRAKKNIDCRFIGQHTQPKRKNVIADQKIRLAGYNTQKKYPETLRLVIYYDPETDKKLHFLTNNFTLAAQTVADLYKARWEIEIFFKWIKQNLKIKTFLGTSQNAVSIQIWTAMIYYLLLSFIKFQTKYSYSMHDLAQIIKELLMENISIIAILNLNNQKCKPVKLKNYQLAFF